VILERGPARKAVRTREYALGIGERDRGRIRASLELFDLGAQFCLAGPERFEQVFGLLAKLGETWLRGQHARGCRLGTRHDDPFPRRLAAWLGVRVANRKKVRWQSIARPGSGGLSPFRGHSSTLNVRRYIIIAGELVNSCRMLRERRRGWGDTMLNLLLVSCSSADTRTIPQSSGPSFSLLA
jgi:hypothetical protein